MRKIHFLLLFLLPFLGQSQPKGLATNITELTYVDTAQAHIWYSGRTFTSWIIQPTGYTVPTWKIVSVMDTTAVIFSGTGRTVSANIIFAGMQACNTYLVMAMSHDPTNVHRPINKIVGKIQNFPASAFFDAAHADVIYDLSTTGAGDHNGGATVHSTGWKILVVNSCASTSCRINFFNYIGNPNFPVVARFVGSNIYTGTSQRNVALGSSQNFIINGCSSKANEYGLFTSKLNQGSVTTENVYFTPTDVTGTYPIKSVGWMVCGINIGGLGSSYGGSGMITQMDTTLYRDSNYTMQWLTIFHCRVSNNKNEHNYHYHTRDYDGGNGPDKSGFPRSRFFFMFDCITDSGQNEAFQCGGIRRGYIFNNTWLNAGNGGGNGQQNIMAIKGGCDSLYIFWNKGWSQFDMVQCFNQTKGRSIEIFGNQFETTKTGVQFLYQLSQQTSPNTNYIGLRHNTFKVPSGTMLQLYNDPTFVVTNQVLKMYSDGNIFISDRTTQVTAFNSFSTANTITNNLAVSSTSGLLFANEANRDYHLSSLSSTAFGWTPNTTCTGALLSQLSGFDMDGYQFPKSNLAYGCYSGLPLMTH